jgi:hypothetical protein
MGRCFNGTIHLRDRLAHFLVRIRPMRRTRAESIGGSVTTEGVLRLYTDGFSRALQQHDFAALQAIYSDRYMLVRPDRSVLNKEQVLEDLIEHKVASTQ